MSEHDASVIGLIAVLVGILSIAVVARFDLIFSFWVEEGMWPRPRNEGQTEALQERYNKMFYSVSKGKYVVTHRFPILRGRLLNTYEDGIRRAKRAARIGFPITYPGQDIRKVKT